MRSLSSAVLKRQAARVACYWTSTRERATLWPVFAHGSKGRLTAHDIDRFPGTTLFERIARAVCDAGCLPRKELYEAWEVARRARRIFRGGRILDLGGGHGLLGQVMLLLDDSSSSAIVVDRALPRSSSVLHHALVAAWPRLAGRVRFVAGSNDDVAVAPGDILVSSHACGALTDRVIDRALFARTPLAILPCCHDAETCDAGPLRGWVDLALAIDIRRAQRLEREGYRVWTQMIPAAITPKNRLLLGAPAEAISRRATARPIA